MTIIVTHDAYQTIAGIQQLPPSITELCGCKNEKIAFQVYLEGMKGILTAAREKIFVPELEQPLYRVEISSDCPEVVGEAFIEGYIPDDDNRLVADRVSRETYTTFSQYQPGVIFAEYAIPKNFSKNQFTVTVSVYHSLLFSDEELIFTQELSVNVLDYTLPDPKDYTMFLDIWQHSSNVARQFGVPLWSDRHFQLLENVIASLADLGQKSIMIVASDCPWCGWGTAIGSKDGSNFYEYSMIDAIKDTEGKLTCDFRNMQRYIDLCKNYAIDGEIALYGLLGVWNKDGFPRNEVKDYSENISVRYFDEADQTFKYMKTAEELVSYFSCIVTYFKETNQFEKLKIATDEPEIKDVESVNAFKVLINEFKAIAPTIKIKMAIDREIAISHFIDDLDTITLSFPCITKHSAINKQQTEKQYLWYVCNIPDKPNTLVKNQLVEARVLGILNSLFDFDGLTRWAYCAWTANPREDIRYEIHGFPTGDFSLVYPAKNGEIERSLRVIQLKKGIIDYELLARLKQVTDESDLTPYYNQIALNQDPQSYMMDKRHTKPNLYSTNYEDYEQLRQAVIKELILHSLREAVK